MSLSSKHKILASNCFQQVSGQTVAKHRTTAINGGPLFVSACRENIRVDYYLPQVGGGGETFFLYFFF